MYNSTSDQLVSIEWSTDVIKLTQISIEKLNIRSIYILIYVQLSSNILYIYVCVYNWSCETIREWNLFQTMLYNQFITQEKLFLKRRNNYVKEKFFWSNNFNMLYYTYEIFLVCSISFILTAEGEYVVHMGGCSCSKMSSIFLLYW